MPKATLKVNIQEPFLGQLPGLAGRNKAAVTRFLADLISAQKNIAIILREKITDEFPSFTFAQYQVVSSPRENPQGLIVGSFFTLWVYQANGGNMCLLVRDDHQVFVAQHVYEYETRFHKAKHFFLILAGSVQNGANESDFAFFDNFRMMKFVAQLANFQKCLLYIKARQIQLRELAL